MLAAGALLPVFVITGPAVLLAGVLVVVTADRLIGRARETRRRRTDLVGVVAALRMFGRELQAGADPDAAATRVATAVHGAGAAAMDALAQQIRAGDRTAPAVTPVAEIRSAPGSYALSRLTSGWRLTARYGVALAPMVDALAAELAERLAADAGLAGQVAGPRTSGYVLAALPLLGVLLGSGMGAEPLRVLLNSALGNILLLAGVTLVCVGLWWSARIVGQ